MTDASAHDTDVRETRRTRRNRDITGRHVRSSWSLPDWASLRKSSAKPSRE